MEANLCRFSIVCLYLYWHWRSNYQERRFGIHSTNLTLPYCCACPKLLSTYVMDFLVFNDFRRELLVSFLYWWNCLTHDDNKLLHNTWDKHRKLSIKLKQNLCCFKTVYWGLSPELFMLLLFVILSTIIVRGRRGRDRMVVCQWLATGRWFSPVSSTNKTDSHYITEILLKVALNLNTINYSLFTLIWILYVDICCGQYNHVRL